MECLLASLHSYNLSSSCKNYREIHYLKYKSSHYTMRCENIISYATRFNIESTWNSMIPRFRQDCTRTRRNLLNAGEENDIFRKDPSIPIPTIVMPREEQVDRRRFLSSCLHRINVRACKYLHQGTFVNFPRS